MEKSRIVKQISQRNENQSPREKINQETEYPQNQHTDKVVDVTVVKTENCHSESNDALKELEKETDKRVWVGPPMQ